MKKLLATLLKSLRVIVLVYPLFNICHNDEIQIYHENGEPVNLKKLVQQYSLICPLTSFCMEGTMDMVGFDVNRFMHSESSYTSDCVTCTCSKGCIETKTCCPDAPFAYENDECLDVTVWSIDNNTLGPNYLIKATCANIVDATTKQRCENKTTDLQPLYSPSTMITYKNEFCARCNGLDTKSMLPWPINLICLKEATGNLQTILRNCIFVYWPVGFRSARDCGQPLKHQVPMFYKCNITGLWTTFDPDIDYACTHFNQPYGKYRNVFCFICNPDKTSIEVKTNNKIDTCPKDSGLDTYFCHSRNATSRLHPYKNVYCRMCNSEYVFENKTGPIKIRQISDPPSLKYTTLEITIAANDDTAKITRDIVLLLSKQSGIKFHIHKDHPSGINIENTSSLVREYASVCGFISVCNRSYLTDIPTEDLPLYRPCPRCDCHDDCVTGLFPCCVDKVLEEKLYRCVNQSNFLAMSLSATESVDIYPEQLSEKSYAVVSECPKSASHHLKSKCSGTDSLDILENIPIVKSSSLAFRNIYCMECYKFSRKENRIYLKFSCDSYFENSLFNSLERMFEIAGKRHCHIAFTMPDANLCYDPDVDQISGMISKCNVTGLWTTADDDTRKACEETDQTGIMNLNMHQYDLVENRYKNPFCALCNQEASYKDGDSDFEMLTKCTLPTHVTFYIDKDVVMELCKRIPVYSWWGRYKNVYCFNCYYVISGYDNITEYGKTSFVWFSYVLSDIRHFSYRTLFSISRKELNEAISEVGIQCENGVFDHEKDKCVDFYCLGTRIMQDGRCIHAFDSLAKVRIIFDIKLKLPIGSAETEGNSTVMIRPFDVCLTIINNLRMRLNHGLIVNVEFQQCDIRATSCMATKIENTSNHTEWELSRNTFLEAEFRIYSNFTNNLTLFEDTIIDTLHVKSFTINNSHFIQHYFDIRNMNAFECVQEIKLTPTEVYGHRKLRRRNKCPLVKYLKTDDLYFDEESDTLIMNKGTTRIPSTDVENVFRNGHQYFLICYDSLPTDLEYRGKSAILLEKSLLNRVYIVFSSCCTGVSLLGLFFTFATYCLFSDLRTVPGKNNMHLSLCLFLAQAGLQYSLGLAARHDSIYCKLTGVIVHYFWLASFCAMNACSYHMFRVFCTREMNIQLSPIQKFQLARKYACYIYLSPFVTIIIVIIAELFHSNLTSIGYGTTNCFIDDFFVKIFSFIIPTGLITLINFIFYVLTFYRLKSSPRVSSSGKDRQNLVIYAKLCSITGILWPIVFVDAVFELSVFSFFVTFLTAMQGVFIFFSFVCNRRVLDMYRKLGVSDFEETNQSVPRTLTATNRSGIHWHNQSTGSQNH